MRTNGQYDRPTVPARTTPLQMIVNFVRSHWADERVVVTESKSLHDKHLDVDVEVDVVVQGKFDGETVVTSIEVYDVLGGRHCTGSSCKSTDIVSCRPTALSWSRNSGSPRVPSQQ